MIHLVKVVVTVIVALLFGACTFNVGGETIKGNGDVTTQERQVSDFTKVEVSKGLDCEITQGNTFKVTVEADSNIHKYIKTTVTNGVLKITSKYGNYRNVKSKKVYVTMPIIEQLETTSASELTTNGTIKSNNILLKSSSASDLNAKVESEQITLEASSGSDLNVSGKAIKLFTLSSSGSDIDAKDLLANEVNAQSSSGSDTKISPLVSLKAQASSGSSIDYFTKPKNKAIASSSGGSISAQ